jgi:hypothetical protein
MFIEMLHSFSFLKGDQSIVSMSQTECYLSQVKKSAESVQDLRFVLTPAVPQSLQACVMIKFYEIITVALLCPRWQLGTFGSTTCRCFG